MPLNFFGQEWNVGFIGWTVILLELYMEKKEKFIIFGRGIDRQAS
jgi:hypothetical protein